MLRLLYILLVYCICYNEIFTKMKYGVSNVKYVVLFILFCYTWRRVGRRKLFFTRWIVYFSWILIISLCLSISTFLEQGFDGLTLWKNYLFFPLLLYIFLYMDSKKTNISITDLCRHFTYGMVSYVYISLLLYYYELPIWNNYHVYWGRLTVGYPTIDTVVLGLAMIMVFFNRELKYSLKEKLFYSLTLTVGIIMQASGTGIIVLSLIIMALFAFLLRNICTNKIHKNGLNLSRTILIYILSIILTSSTAYTIFKKNNPELAIGMEAQVTNRINIALGKQDNSIIYNVNTWEVRQNYMNNAERFLRGNDVNRIFGVGYGNISMINYDKPEFVKFEDQYNYNLFTIGYFGAAICFIMLIDYALLVLKKTHNDIISLFLYDLPTIVIGASCFTSICLTAIGILSFFALYYSMFVNDYIKK